MYHPSILQFIAKFRKKSQIRVRKMRFSPGKKGVFKILNIDMESTGLELSLLGITFELYSVIGILEFLVNATSASGKIGCATSASGICSKGI